MKMLKNLFKNPRTFYIIPVATTLFSMFTLYNSTIAGNCAVKRYLTLSAETGLNYLLALAAIAVSVDILNKHRNSSEDKPDENIKKELIGTNTRTTLFKDFQELMNQLIVCCFLCLGGVLLGNMARGNELIFIVRVYSVLLTVTLCYSTVLLTRFTYHRVYEHQSYRYSWIISYITYVLAYGYINYLFVNSKEKIILFNLVALPALLVLFALTLTICIRKKKSRNIS